MVAYCDSRNKCAGEERAKRLLSGEQHCLQWGALFLSRTREYYTGGSGSGDIHRGELRGGSRWGVMLRGAGILDYNSCV